jgi:hypothetical protein
VIERALMKIEKFDGVCKKVAITGMLLLVLCIFSFIPAMGLAGIGKASWADALVNVVGYVMVADGVAMASLGVVVGVVFCVLMLRERNSAE